MQVMLPKELDFLCCFTCGTFPPPVRRFVFYFKNFFLEKTMKIKINSKERETAARTLAALAEELGLPAQGVAVAVNGKLVPRVAWNECALADGAGVTVVKAVCGG